MFTISCRALRLDSVLFVERSGELLYVARLSTLKVRSRRETESEMGAQVTCNRPETG